MSAEASHISFIPPARDEEKTIGKNREGEKDGAY